MSRIRGKDTTIELILRSALHRAGLRFRKNVKGLPGTPDIVFHHARLLVFVDGDFGTDTDSPDGECHYPSFGNKKFDATEHAIVAATRGCGVPAGESYEFGNMRYIATSTPPLFESPIFSNRLLNDRISYCTPF